MRKKVAVKMNTITNKNGGEIVDSIISYGFLEDKDSLLSISFSDKKSPILFEVTKSKVVVSRKVDSLENIYEFKNNETTILNYKTEFGVFKFKIFTKEINFEDKMIEIKYDLIYDGQIKDEFVIKLFYKEQEDEY
ncbi:MAG: DUF1934 family protein [Bacilli bacterium]|nr:DUF1934 family protein [Bacilli bacterium]